MKRNEWYLKLMLGLSLALMPFGNSVSADENLPADAWKVEILSPKEGFQYPSVTFETDLTVLYFSAKSKELFFFPDYIVVRFGKSNQSFFTSKLIDSQSGYFEGNIGGLEFVNYAGPLYIWAESWKKTNTAMDKKVAQTEKRLIYLVDPASAPDLALSSFEVVTLMPGEKALNGTISDKKRYHFVWTVKNVGDKIALDSKLKIECQALGDESCPSSLNKSYDIKQLWPKPENVSGATKIWNVDPFLPTSQAQFRFKATIDPDNRLVEQKKTNNQRVNEFVATPMDDLNTSIPPEKLRDRVAVIGQKDIAPLPGGFTRPQIVASAPLPLEKGSAFSANSLTTLPVKHMTGQKPVYEFELYDGSTWRKERSIRQFGVQTPPRAGSGQVISKASFRITKPGKYRYRVKTDAPGASFSPYQEFVVVDPRATKSMAQASAQSKRAKVVAEQSSAAGAPPSKMNIPKSPAKTGKSSPPANSATVAQSKDTATPQVKVQRQPIPPSIPPKITAPRPNQSFAPPANVMVKISHDSRFVVVFEVSKDAGKFLKAKSGDLRKLSAGKYRIKVGYKGKPQRSQVNFVVKMPIKKQAVTTQPQPTTQPQINTPPPIRRSVSPQ